MKRLFEFLWDGCWHQWKYAGKTRDFHCRDENGNRAFLHRTVAMQCTKCGNIKELVDVSGTFQIQETQG